MGKLATEVKAFSRKGLGERIGVSLRKELGSAYYYAIKREPLGRRATLTTDPTEQTKPARPLALRGISLWS